ncbi:MAG: glycosyltransferase [Patescibacteria group bacterium]|nr:glycosyltransferase [Patescibacteria group bacterium]
MKKKLLFVITKSNWGGAQRYVYDLAASLNTDYDLAVAAGGGGILLERLRGTGIRTIPLSSLARDIHTKGDVAAFFELYRLFRRERPDIVHLNSSKAGALGALAARLAGVPRVIFTVHGWPFNEPVSPLSKTFRWSASLATLLLCHESITVSRFGEMHAPLGLKTVMIHNGIETPQFLPRSEARAKLGIAENAPFIIGTIAELHRNKGIDILIDALPQVAHALLVIVGDGEERAALETRVTRLQLEERVEFAGFVPDASSLLKAFDLFVLPSRTEALGYVLLEAGAAGMPVVASTVGGIPEVIEDGLSGALFPAYDADALAETLNTLMASPGTRAHYGERLAENTARYFNLRGMVKKTVEVYEEPVTPRR